MTDEELKMLDEVLEKDSGLSGREIDFVQRLEDEMRDRELSPKQYDWLKDLASR